VYLVSFDFYCPSKYGSYFCRTLYNSKSLSSFGGLEGRVGWSGNRSVESRMSEGSVCANQFAWVGPTVQWLRRKYSVIENGIWRFVKKRWWNCSQTNIDKCRVKNFKERSRDEVSWRSPLRRGRSKKPRRRRRNLLCSLHQLILASMMKRAKIFKWKW
jgi:hypothetical protein